MSGGRHRATELRDSTAIPGCTCDSIDTPVTRSWYACLHLPRSISMFTNAAGLFTCGTMFDKGLKAIYINAIITLVGLSIGECCWRLGKGCAGGCALLRVR